MVKSAGVGVGVGTGVVVRSVFWLVFGFTLRFWICIGVSYRVCKLFGFGVRRVFCCSDFYIVVVFFG